MYACTRTVRVTAMAFVIVIVSMVRGLFKYLLVDFYVIAHAVHGRQSRG